MSQLTKEDSEKALNEIQRKVAEAEKAGVELSTVKNMLKLAMTYHEAKNWDRVIKFTKRIEEELSQKIVIPEKVESVQGASVQAGSQAEDKKKPKLIPKPVTSPTIGTEVVDQPVVSPEVQDQKVEVKPEVKPEVKSEQKPAVIKVKKKTQ